MKVFYMSLRYWVGTLFILTLLPAILGLVTLSFWTVVLSLILFVFGGIASFPLIIPCMLLLRITARLPYSATGKTWWFGTLFSLVHMTTIFVVRYMFPGFFEFPLNSSIFYFSPVAVIIVTCWSRNDLENLYKQQTNQQ